MSNNLENKELLLLLLAFRCCCSPDEWKEIGNSFKQSISQNTHMSYVFYV